MARGERHGTVVRVRERKRATGEELSMAIRGLLLVSVDVLRAAGEVRTLDVEWIEENVRIPGTGDTEVSQDHIRRGRAGSVGEAR